MILEIPDEELDIHIEQRGDHFIVRVIHKPTMTIKISDLFPTADEAVKQAYEGLVELVKMRRDGLG